METSFWFGYQLNDFLFHDFDVESGLGFLAICIVVAVLVIVFEFLKTSRVIKKLKFYTYDERSIFKLAFCAPSERSILLERPEHIKEVWKISDISYHFFELLIGYLLMLIAMTFNGYIMISICVGAGIAYLTMGSTLMNVTAQMVTQKMCNGCHNKDGECTPVTELMNEEASTSTGIHCEAMNGDDITTTVQVHL